MQPRLVPEGAWERGRANLEQPVRPVMAVSMDPSGKRASAVLAWQQTDGSIAIRVEANVTGDPIDTDRLGQALQERANRVGAAEVGYDDWTDKELARYFKKSKAIGGKDYANASENFVRVIEAGRLRWDAADDVSEDLAWTARRQHEQGAFMAVKASDERPITAVLAAIRAVWLASGPRPPTPRIY